jgi:thioredoxin reductase (NADPH)
VIVGAGPAGLSAAIYMGRFRRRTLVLDDANGRWSYGQRNENYLGFPHGVSARRLQRLGRAQGARFGVRFEAASVRRVGRTAAGFVLHTSAGRRRARTVIWAAGVQDRWPDFPQARRLVGRRLFWCIVCDGWRARDCSVLLLADSASDAKTALQFLTYTRKVTFLYGRSARRMSQAVCRRLSEAGLDVLEGRVKSVRVRGQAAASVTLADGRRLRAYYLFSLLGQVAKTEPLRGLSLPLSPLGHVRVDDKSRTRLPGFFAAGDVTDKHAHQIAAAVHEGAAAAMAANHALYPPWQKLEPQPRAARGESSKRSRRSQGPS